MSLTASISAQISGKQTKAAKGGESAELDFANSASLSLVNGTGAGKADLAYDEKARALATATSENIDLSGVLVDDFGATIAFAKIKALMIKADKANTTVLSVGGAASNGFVTPFGDATDIVKVAPGGALLLFNDAGWVVTAATGDLLKIANAAGATAHYDITLIGTSA